MKHFKNKSIFLILILLLPIIPYSEATEGEINESTHFYSPVSTFYPFNGSGHHPVGIYTIINQARRSRSQLTEP